MRAGALGIVVAPKVDSGRIVALAGAVSDCSLDALNRSAGAEANGRIATLGPQPGRPPAGQGQPLAADPLAGPVAAAPGSALKGSAWLPPSTKA